MVLTPPGRRLGNLKFPDDELEGSVVSGPAGSLCPPPAGCSNRSAAGRPPWLALRMRSGDGDPRQELQSPVRLVCLMLLASPLGATFLSTLVPVTPFWSLPLEQGSSPCPSIRATPEPLPRPPTSRVSCQKRPLGKWRRASEHRLWVPLQALLDGEVASGIRTQALGTLASTPGRVHPDRIPRGGAGPGSASAGRVAPGGWRVGLAGQPGV